MQRPIEQICKDTLDNVPFFMTTGECCRHLSRSGVACSHRVDEINATVEFPETIDMISEPVRSFYDTVDDAVGIAGGANTVVGKTYHVVLKDAELAKLLRRAEHIHQFASVVHLRRYLDSLLPPMDITSDLNRALNERTLRVRSLKRRRAEFEAIYANSIAMAKCLLKK